jgi:ABC-type uncharacterized transport system substrate-binding protein
MRRRDFIRVVIVGQTTPVIRGTEAGATSSIPIIMAAVNDPVDQGFVSSLAHPGGKHHRLHVHASPPSRNR